MSNLEIPQPFIFPKVTSEEAGMRLSALAIDQVILDGLVDGAERRVTWGTLLDTAFQDTHSVQTPGVKGFKEGILSDSRYKDRVNKSYGYEPEFTGPEEMRPRPKAVLEGTAQCTEAERQAVLDRMECYAQILFSNHDDSRPIRLGSMRRVIGRALGLELPYVEFVGLQAFVRADPRFVQKPKGGQGMLLRPGPGLDEKIDENIDEKIKAALSRRGERSPRGFYQPRKMGRI